MNTESSWVLRNSTTSTKRTIEELGRYSLRALDTVADQLKIAHSTTDSNSRAQIDALDRLGQTTTNSIHSVMDAVEDFRASFQLAHQEQAWFLRKQLDVLTGIENAMRNPRAVQAEELLKMGRQCIAAGMLDQATRLLCEAEERNPLDYRVYVTNGFALLALARVEGAKEKFELALRNARTAALTAEAHFLLARTHRELKHFEIALSHLIKSSELERQGEQWSRESGIVARSTYEFARTVAMLPDQTRAGHVLDARNSLAQAIRLDPEIFALAFVDPAIRSIPGAKPQLEELYSAAAKAAEAAVANLRRFVRSIAPEGGDDARQLEAQLRVAEQKTASGSYAALMTVPSQARSSVEKFLQSFSAQANRALDAAKKARDKAVASALSSLERENWKIDEAMNQEKVRAKALVSEIKSRYGYAPARRKVGSYSGTVTDYARRYERLAKARGYGVWIALAVFAIGLAASMNARRHLELGIAITASIGLILGFVPWSVVATRHRRRKAEAAGRAQEIVDAIPRFAASMREKAIAEKDDSIARANSEFQRLAEQLKQTHAQVSSATAHFCHTDPLAPTLLGLIKPLL